MQQIDSEKFDVKKSFESLLKSKNLTKLVQTNLEIQAEIKDLDHDVQSLVFKNYSKFISSIEVVKKMRQELEKTEQSLDKLSQSIDNIKNMSEKIDDTLKPKRDEIQKLDKINKDLSNLRMLCELPLMLKEDLKQLHTLDVRNLSREDLLKQKEQLEKICQQSLQNLDKCQEKLLQFHQEPLISPIFADVNKHLNEIQKFLFLHFYENHHKMDFSLLSDLFKKLFNITLLVDKISRITKKSSTQISIDSVTQNYFKNMTECLMRQLQYFKSSSQSLTDLDFGKIKECNFNSSTEYGIFRIKMIEILAKRSDEHMVKKYQDLLKQILEKLVENEQCILKKEFKEKGEFYLKQKQDFLRKTLFKIYSESNLNFYQKIHIIVANYKLLCTLINSENNPVQVIVETLVQNDILNTLDFLKDQQDQILVKLELVDQKSQKFPVIRDEMSIKKAISDIADDFTKILSHYAKFILETIQSIGNEFQISFGNLDKLLKKFLDKIIASYNSNTYYNQDLMKYPEALEYLQFNNKQDQKPPIRLRPLNYVFLSRLVDNFDQSSQHQQLLNTLLSNVSSYLQKSWTELYVQSIHNAQDQRILQELVNSISTLLFLINNLSSKGKPQSRITKSQLTKMYPQITGTSKLLAKQAFLFEKKQQQITKLCIAQAFSKLFYKNLDLFFKNNTINKNQLETLFAFIIQASQILFELATKEEESIIAAMFYQILEQIEKTGFDTNIERVNYFLKNAQNQFFQQIIMKFQFMENLEKQQQKNYLLYNYLQLNPNTKDQLYRQRMNSFSKIILTSFLSVGYIAMTNLKKNLGIKIIQVINLNLFVFLYQFYYRFPLNMQKILEKDPSYFKNYMYQKGNYDQDLFIKELLNKSIQLIYNGKVI